MSDAKVKMGNPVENVTVPEAPVPSQVGRPLPKQQLVEKEKDEELGVVDESSPLPTTEESKSSSKELDKMFGPDVDKEPKGTIHISIYMNSPYTVDFEGIVTGSEIDMAWRAMMKEYRVWKHIMFKKIEQEKTDGGG